MKQAPLEAKQSPVLPPAHKRDLRQVERNSKEDNMRALQQPDEVETLHLELIHCSRQPGKLRISKHACASRYLKAQNTRRNTFASGGSVSSRWSLELCRTCPDGRRQAKEMAGSSAEAKEAMEPHG